MSRTTRGSATVVLCLGLGLGPAAPGFALELSSGDILVSCKDAIMHVDPATGNRTILSGSGVGSGPTLTSPVGVALEGGDYVVTVDQWNDTVLRIQPASGDRTTISSSSVGTGPSFGLPTGLARESDGGILVTNSATGCGSCGEGEVFRIDPATGDRTILSSNSVGLGPPFAGVTTEVAVDEAGDVFVTDNGTDSVYVVNPTTGDRVVLSNPSIGSGPIFDNPQGVDVAPDGTVFVTDPDVDGGWALYEIQPGSGDRSIISSPSLGSGPALDRPFGTTVDANGDILVVDSTQGLLVRIARQTGDRTLISGGGVGSGPAMELPVDAFEVPSGRWVFGDSISIPPSLEVPVAGPAILGIHSDGATFQNLPGSITIPGYGGEVLAAAPAATSFTQTITTPGQYSSTLTLGAQYSISGPAIELGFVPSTITLSQTNLGGAPAAASVIFSLILPFRFDSAPASFVNVAAHYSFDIDASAGHDPLLATDTIGVQSCTVPGDLWLDNPTPAICSAVGGLPHEQFLALPGTPLPFHVDGTMSFTIPTNTRYTHTTQVTMWIQDPAGPAELSLSDFHVSWSARERAAVPALSPNGAPVLAAALFVAAGLSLCWTRRRRDPPSSTQPSSTQPYST